MSNLETNPMHDETTFRGVSMHILRHPIETAIKRWHWKSALFSGLIRMFVFLIGYHNKGTEIMLAAAGIQFVYRTVLGGIGGSIIQRFSKVEPPWHATITVPLIITVITHIFEYFIQIAFDNYYGTNLATKTTIASIVISVMSAVFNLYLMRRGVMLVKDEQEKSLGKDFAYIPVLLFDFIMIPPRNIYKRICQKQYLMAIFVFLMTGLGTGLIGAILRFRESWGYWTGSIVMGLIIITVAIIALVDSRKEKKIEPVSEFHTDPGDLRV
ncbi:MAG: hypothetical protein K1X72_24105 [Pyrinomonadaceae bacterium]|nr:hypothetical protein [Pyrinomonadaceae bacterium]